VLLNLAVNARDAMEGTPEANLTIELHNATLDETYTEQRSEVLPGDYVLLAVSDNGCGMTPEIEARIFEPFFTTKPQGQGTGLGLATCHGIIKQSGGHIAVYSEVGRGTTFKIYLPRVEAEADAVRHNAEVVVAPAGTGTVLLVEDEPMLRELGLTVLQELGYEVLVAGNGCEALALLKVGKTARFNHPDKPIISGDDGHTTRRERFQCDAPHTYNGVGIPEQ